VTPEEQAEFRRKQFIGLVEMESEDDLFEVVVGAPVHVLHEWVLTAVEMIRQAET
jgi:hypothetical protein